MESENDEGTGSHKGEEEGGREPIDDGGGGREEVGRGACHRGVGEPLDFVNGVTLSVAIRSTYIPTNNNIQKY